jgi:hypothetical protein
MANRIAAENAKENRKIKKLAHLKEKGAATLTSLTS